MDSLVAVMTRDRDDDCPNLLVLLCECLVAIYVSLFAYAFTAYDSRWLYRLVAHSVDPRMFAAVFGGGGVVHLAAQPAGPPPSEFHR